MSFLKAEWRKLIMANYEVQPEILQKYLPKGTEIDIFEGKCYVSLVGFMFLKTRLLGIKVPFHINFEEVNLRFYVKRKVEDEIKRGVVFIKEIVPKPALTFVANVFYNEHYQTLPMKHFWNIDKEKIEVSYEWKVNNKWNKVSVEAETKPQKIAKKSQIEFIAEHYWGYSKINAQKATEYEVKHPTWQYYPVTTHQILVDFQANYGADFGFLNNKQPSSVLLLEGSEVSVENKVIF
ncbi:DUF2071 domain-containing protein [Polaribacter batillariae]|uniref:DUF2071 domain-containing protein n=1 Tax=Polaribacter batillariae TaxID=2808900 RepID=A0ABX7SWS3_9FLAO|nr:DUF2071 domain-containing protein [Polaribacter batillariae]QTD37426.1 DUF2071 domain-containing protein [Polaribacter batillariae]